MSLQRKENNLRKAQKRLEKVSKRSKQFQIDFRRKENKKGRFRTRAYIVRGEKQFHGNNRGLLHKFAHVRYRITGDKPSVTKTIKSWQPKTVKGKLFRTNARAVNFAVHDAGQTAVDTALAAETVGLKASDITQREVRYKLKQKYTREAVDDYHRGVFLMGRSAVDAVKGTRNHLKAKKPYKLEKAKLKVKKADNKLYQAKTGKPKLHANKADLKKAKAEYKAKKKGAKCKTNGKSIKKLERKEYKQTKRELKFERKQLKTENKFRTKALKNQRKIAKLSKPGLLVLKPASYTAGRMKASAWQKAVNEDTDNDVLHALDSAKRRVVEPAKQKISKPQRLQKHEKKRESLNDKKLKSDQRLNRQENKLKDKHDTHKKSKSTKKSRNAKEKVSDALKAAWSFVKNVYESEVKKFFLCLAIPVLVILLGFGLFTAIFSATSSNGGFTLGTYASQDYDLSEAEKYYTQLAYNLNEKVRKVGNSSDWKNGLSELGVDTSGMKDTPDNWIWGQSGIYNWTPQYDFDCYKLWAFLCAYYYDFDADNDDIYYWSFGSGTEDLLDEIFNSEYEFVSHYDNTSHWEYRSQFNSQGYYSINSSGVTGSYGYIEISYPDALPFSGYNNGNTIYFSLDNGEVLNYSDDFSATGWYLKHQFVDEYDPNGNKYEAWYTGGETCSFGIYENGVLVTPIPYVIPEENWCSFLKKYDWVTDCRLYYNVKQKKTFDEVITEKLGNMSNSAERLQYYGLLVGTDGTASMHGNHQTLHNLLPGATVRDYSLKRQFGYEMTGWNNESEGLYQGIKVYCNNGDTLKAPFKCKISEVNTDENKIKLRKDDVEYWYDGTGSTKRDTEVEIANATLLSGFAEGDTINDGQEFAKITAGNVNFHVYIDTDGYGWDYIDPRLVLY
ncbi:MAG: hypothetical protein MJ100_09510 [Ruminococcus sp.]|nr:hypothetical protein [Ruminococcus sp.]